MANNIEQSSQRYAPLKALQLPEEEKNIEKAKTKIIDAQKQKMSLSQPTLCIKVIKSSEEYDSNETLTDRVGITINKEEILKESKSDRDDTPTQFSDSFEEKFNSSEETPTEESEKAESKKTLAEANIQALEQFDSTNQMSILFSRTVLEQKLIEYTNRFHNRIFYGLDTPTLDQRVEAKIYKGPKLPKVVLRYSPVDTCILRKMPTGEFIVSAKVGHDYRDIQEWIFVPKNKYEYLLKLMVGGYGEHIYRIEDILTWIEESNFTLITPES
jgi:hypothetical protein